MNKREGTEGDLRPSEDLIISPRYPVSSYNSRKAHVSSDSFGLTRPAGTSIHTAFNGGRYCFSRSRRGAIP